MKAGVEVIHCAVLHDEPTRTYGMPDLLVRGDVLERLFPGVYALELERKSDEEGCAPDAPARLVAPRLGGSHHYRVLDSKFTGLHLAASGELGNGGSGLAYKAQLFLYNRALGSAQGLIPPAAFLLGRSWEQGEDGGRGCLERLAPVFQTGTFTRKESLADAANAAVAWVRGVRQDGAHWSVDPEPCIPELRPNMKHTQDAPWHAAKEHH